MTDFSYATGWNQVRLDGALQKLANHSYGSWLLGIVAAGLLAYAVFCLFEARYRKV
ncbi:MAG: DUF1206 domain-containing protein [Gemmatimonadota bacterium]|nr:DUF1206 domain-containing protein [Gemmatimonadota bacterium]